MSRAARERDADLTEELTIGQLARRTGVNRETVRYYERIGLLDSPPRTASGYRRYRGEDVRRLIFIRRARDLGFSLDRVRTLLGLAAAPDRNCAEVRSVAIDHLAEIRGKLADLRRMERVLAELVAACGEGRQPACPLVEVLSVRQ
jgi:MerR family mercuric resistance operon transcriptional regulator